MSPHGETNISRERLILMSTSQQRFVTERFLLRTSTARVEQSSSLERISSLSLTAMTTCLPPTNNLDPSFMSLTASSTLQNFTSLRPLVEKNELRAAWNEDASDKSHQTSANRIEAERSERIWQQWRSHDVPVILFSVANNATNTRLSQTILGTSMISVRDELDTDERLCRPK